METSENNDESQRMDDPRYWSDQVLLEIPDEHERLLTKDFEIPRLPSRDINGRNPFLIYNAPPKNWSIDPKDYEDLLSNPNREAERNLREDAIHDWIVDLTYTIRQRHNSLGLDATDEERNDPHAIGLHMLGRTRYDPSCPTRTSATKGCTCKPDCSVPLYGAKLFRTNRRLSRRLGLIHPIFNPSGRVGFYAQQRFGRDGGELQDLWYCLYVRRTELDNPGLRAIAQALHYAHIWGPNERDLEED